MTTAPAVLCQGTNQRSPPSPPHAGRAAGATTAIKAPRRPLGPRVRSPCRRCSTGADHAHGPTRPAPTTPTPAPRRPPDLRESPPRGRGPAEKHEGGRNAEGGPQGTASSTARGRSMRQKKVPGNARARGPICPPRRARADRQVHGGTRRRIVGLRGPTATADRPANRVVPAPTPRSIGEATTPTRGMQPHGRRSAGTPTFDVIM